MATISQEKIEASQKIAVRTNKLAAILFRATVAIHFIATTALLVGLYLGYRVGKRTSIEWTTGKLHPVGSIDWQLVLANWGVMIGAWLFFTFVLLVISVFGSLAQAQSQSLEIQTVQAQP